MAENLADQHRSSNVSHVTTHVTTKQIAEWLTGRWPERGPADVTGFHMAQGGGSSSIIVADYAQGGASGRIVLRLQPPDDPVFHAASSHASMPEREWAAQQAIRVHAPGVPLPALLAIEPDPRFLGRPFFAMGFVEGKDLKPFGFMSTGALAEASPDQRRALMLGMMDHLAAIHAIDAGVPELARFHAGKSGRETTLLHLDLLDREARDKLAGRSFPTLLNGLRWLRDHVPDDDRVGLNWGDARVGNSLLGADFQPLALLDWEGTALLPTESDLGWWSLYDIMERRQSGDAVLPGMPSLQEQLDRYVAVSGREIRDLAYWQMLAAVRTALVLMRLRDRLENAGIATPLQLATRFDNFSTRFIEERL